MFAHNPLHGSGQAEFPHPAPALGEDAHARQWIGMTDGRRRQPASDETRMRSQRARPFRRCPREQLRMTRGRRGSLIHFRMTFSFTTPCRF